MASRSKRASLLGGLVGDVDGSVGRSPGSRLVGRGISHRTPP
nr:hypothetical protein [Janibacter limosus]